MEVFDKFEDFGCEPNADTYYFTINALCRRLFFDWALSVSEKMVNAEILPDAEKVGKIVSWFCKGKKAKEAHLMYTLAKEKEPYPPYSSVNFFSCWNGNVMKIWRLGKFKSTLDWVDCVFYTSRHFSIRK
ncbi:hypothetical protein PanWU01x14_188860 [Parasponia andersonii]|uniref:Pentatricopeptide repeat n=1 Tax=Parasponia andersonii TaxID=3476 RepID=A0A2P5C2W4_PARAD|nr:hypothetical protein PanWU01x14_188860 [Parasponia andersonii]